MPPLDSRLRHFQPMRGKNGTGRGALLRRHAILTSATPKSGDAVSSSRRLLLVDADPDVHHLLTGLLKREDRGIEDAYDGREAVDRVRSVPYDLVVAGQ